MVEQYTRSRIGISRDDEDMEDEGAECDGMKHIIIAILKRECVRGCLSAEVGKGKLGLFSDLLMKVRKSGRKGSRRGGMRLGGPSAIAFGRC